MYVSIIGGRRGRCVHNLRWVCPLLGIFPLFWRWCLLMGAMSHCSGFLYCKKKTRL